MDRAFVFLSALGAFTVLCQWYVFVRTRRYLLRKDQDMGRVWSYAVLAALGLVNVVGMNLAVDSHLLPADTDGRKIASVVMFSYFGCVLILCLFFLALGLLAKGLDLGEALVILATRPRHGPQRHGLDQRGFVCSGGFGGGSECPQEAKDRQTAADSPSPGPVSRATIAPDSALTARGADRPDPRRRAFLQWTTAAALAGTLGFAFKGMAEGFQAPVVKEFDVFHPALQGIGRPLTFAQVTDFHYGMFFGSEELKELVELLNRLDLDAIFITGDVFHSPMSPVERAAPILRQLKPRRLGNIVIMGNHDFYTGEHRTIQAFKDGGLRVLRNEWVTFREGDAQVHLGGLDDPMANWLWGKEFPQFQAFAARAPRNPGLRIVLSHRPNVLPFAADAGFDLVLAGHTHGGQITFPVPGTGRGMSIAGLVSEYTRGWYRLGKSRMYLSPGVGLTFVPWRVNCPPEIAVFRLKPSTDGQTRVGARSATEVMVAKAEQLY